MTPREFAEHVEQESARISQVLDCLIEVSCQHGAPVAIQTVAMEAALSELNRLARQHAIEQEHTNESR